MCGNVWYWTRYHGSSHPCPIGAEYERWYDKTKEEQLELAGRTLSVSVPAPLLPKGKTQSIIVVQGSDLELSHYHAKAQYTND